jgi:hypothetical protein
MHAGVLDLLEEPDDVVAPFEVVLPKRENARSINTNGGWITY